MMKKYFIILLTIGLLSGCQNDDSDIPEPDDNLNNRPVGASATEILSDESYRSIELEIQYMAGYEPEGASINNLREFLDELVIKPSGVQIKVTEIPASDKENLSADDIRKIEEEYRTVYSEGSKLGIYLLITNGAYTNPNVLGIAYRNTSMALFGKIIHDNTGGLTQPSRTKLETTVMEHEFGHIMGLVDNGSPMQASHQDPEHEGHCNNEECLMYYASETTAVLEFLVSSAVPGLDEYCRNDLKANGGK